MGVSENSGFSPQIIHFNWDFHFKPSILGYHYFWKHPYWQNAPAHDAVDDWLYWFVIFRQTIDKIYKNGGYVHGITLTHPTTNCSTSDEFSSPWGWSWREREECKVVLVPEAWHVNVEASKNLTRNILVGILHIWWPLRSGKPTNLYRRKPKGIQKYLQGWNFRAVSGSQSWKMTLALKLLPSKSEVSPVSLFFWGRGREGVQS